VSLFTHALNIGGFGLPPVLRMPRAGHTVTRVQWDGCMATERNGQDVGDLVRYESRVLVGIPRSIDGMVVKYDKLGEQWEPLAHLRMVDGSAEVWV
jgi:hypothetical protein